MFQDLESVGSYPTKHIPAQATDIYGKKFTPNTIFKKTIKHKYTGCL